jgi:hypothetical protein
MASRLLVVLLTLVLVVTPVNAQTGRILLDMTIQTLPGVESGHCLYVDAGRFVMEGRLVGENRQPVRFNLGPAVNVPANLDLRITTPSPTNATAQVEAGVYCYTLTSQATGDAASNTASQASQLGQLTAVRLIWLPAS